MLAQPPTKPVFNCLVIIGRFQPFHLGHWQMLQLALEQSELVLIVCGSAYQPRSKRNPWTLAEREQMIRESLTEAENKRVLLLGFADNLYADDLWFEHLAKQINTKTQDRAYLHEGEARWGLVHGDSNTNAKYFQRFPHWQPIRAQGTHPACGTELREIMFANSHPSSSTYDRLAPQLPDSVANWLQTEFFTSRAFSQLCKEHDFIQEYRAGWDRAPYPPNFVTCDALVEQNNHILIIERDRCPGEGLWALPGGFVDPAESIYSACLRELEEETGLEIPAAQLAKSLQGEQYFDAPYRSARGRTITHVFHFKLPNSKQLTPIVAGDDARAAFWVPLNELTSEQFFEDHFSIIRSILCI